MAHLESELIYSRERLRLRYLAAVKLTTLAGVTILGNLRDIGLEGIFMKTDRSAKDSLISDTVEIAITVTQGESRLTISTPGSIVREESDGYAIKFSEPLKWWPIFSHFPVNESFMFDVVSKA